MVSYNADAKGNKRLCYVGQDLFLSGKGLGERIVELVPEPSRRLYCHRTEHPAAPGRCQGDHQGIWQKHQIE